MSFQGWESETPAPHTEFAHEPMILKERKKVKIRNQYNQVPHLTQVTIYESDKTQDIITYRRAKRSAGDHKAARHRQDNIVKQIQIKRSTKEVFCVPYVRIEWGGLSTLDL